MRPSLAWSEVATTAYPPGMTIMFFGPSVIVTVMLLMILMSLAHIHLCGHDDDALNDLIDDDQLTLSKGEDSGVREV